MIQSVKIINFTGFKESEIHFSKGLNLLIGENGAGKSNLLRLLYSVTSVSADEGKKKPNTIPTKNSFQPLIAQKLLSVFRPESLGRLVKRKQGREKCEIDFKYLHSSCDIKFSFSSNSRNEVEIEKLPTETIQKQPVFFPTRELLSIYPGFVSLYELYHLEFEETWRDTCLLLGAPLTKGPREKKIQTFLQPLEEAMGGNLVLEPNGRFYLSLPGKGKLEIPLTAEGIRKIAMLSRLIASGALLEQGCLFWDEPESNLNPKYIKLVAKIIFDLASHGLQVFAATHSLFFLKEIEILSRMSKIQSSRYIGLSEKNEEFLIEQGNDIADLSLITVLEEDLMQSDRFMEMR
ncbi:MAG TPA: ATP-binding protein [Spirochaetia bacterium]|nr:ATP-binding protein [Spirochaetia bacterium]